jgi:hypothetical protein
MAVVVAAVVALDLVPAAQRAVVTVALQLHRQVVQAVVIVAAVVALAAPPIHIDPKGIPEPEEHKVVLVVAVAGLVVVAVLAELDLLHRLLDLPVPAGAGVLPVLLLLEIPI